MFSKRFMALIVLAVLVFSAVAGYSQVFPENQNDPVLKKIIEIGQTDNKAMKWLDTFTNRFGGRYTGSDAYNNAANWAVYNFHRFGMQAHLEEVGEVAVGFNRGPWSGKIITPNEKTLYFGTPANTAGTKGIQRGTVVIAPEDSLQAPLMKDQFKGKWVLIHGASNGMARDGRRVTKKSLLVRTLEEAGALGTIQRGTIPLKILDGAIPAWENLPVLPDIKLKDTEYDEIKIMVENGERVELEFDIRNWFKLGPVKYHNVVAWIPGTTYPDEYLILSGHLDSFDGSTGAVDCGAGISPAMEAVRLIMEAGGKPKRNIMVILFAAEEMGIVGAQAWTRNNQSKIPNVGLLLNRDYTPGAVNSITIPETWADDFADIARPLKNLNPDFPFELNVNGYPGVQSTRPSGTDASAFSMVGIPTPRLGQITEYDYGRAWHTLFDTYNEIVPYTKHQEHTAVVLAIMAYGIANLDHQLTRDRVYLEDGLYADINTDKGRMIVSLDYKEVPETVSSFINMFEIPGDTGRRRRRGPAGPAIGVFSKLDSKTAAHGKITLKKHAERAASKMPKEKNYELKHDQAGVLGMLNSSSFYLTSDKKSSYNRKRTPIGTVIAGLDVVSTIAKGDSIRSIRITRVGKKANDFKK